MSEVVTCLQGLLAQWRATLACGSTLMFLTPELAKLLAWVLENTETWPLRRQNLMKMGNEGEERTPTIIQNTGVHSQDSGQQTCVPHVFTSPQPDLEASRSLWRGERLSSGRGFQGSLGIPAVVFSVGSEPVRCGLMASPRATLSVRSYHDTFRIFN